MNVLAEGMQKLLAHPARAEHPVAPRAIGDGDGWKLISHGAVE